MTTEATPGALGSNDQLGLVPERESVDDALMIVESYGPWGADLNGAHRRQIVLSDEVLRLRGLYEMAVRGRAEMRAALRQERRAEELHEGCRMPMEQARELAASEASQDWYARGQDWGLADALTAGQNEDWTLDDIARAFAAGAQAGGALESKRAHEVECRCVALEEQADLTAIHLARMQSALEQNGSRSADYLRKAIKAEATVEAMQARQAEFVAVLARLCELNAAERPMARVWAAAQALVDSHTSRALGPNVRGEA